MIRNERIEPDKMNHQVLFFYEKLDIVYRIVLF